MAINVKITDSEPQSQSVNVRITEPEPIKVKIPDAKRIYEFKLNLRKALNGDLMIFDHADIDIIIMITCSGKKMKYDIAKTTHHHRADNQHTSLFPPFSGLEGRAVPLSKMADGLRATSLNKELWGSSQYGRCTCP